jgi:hypothetical protein
MCITAKGRNHEIWNGLFSCFNEGDDGSVYTVRFALTHESWAHWTRPEIVMQLKNQDILNHFPLPSRVGCIVSKSKVRVASETSLWVASCCHSSG